MLREGQLFIIATPIGNLGDITARAIATLKAVNFVLCEDTRVSQKLFAEYSLKKEVVSYHQHSDAKKTKDILARLAAGESAALITDAGTPGISDPGNPLVAAAIKAGITVIAIPGPSAVIAALSISGFPTDKFLFLGFPPHKNKRQKYFAEVAAAGYTVALYESCHRIGKTLRELSAVLDKRREVMVGRELTKAFETVYRGTIEEILKQDIKNKGEFVIIISAK